MRSIQSRTVSEPPALPLQPKEPQEVLELSGFRSEPEAREVLLGDGERAVHTHTHTPLHITTHQPLIISDSVRGRYILSPARITQTDTHTHSHTHTRTHFQLGSRQIWKGLRRMQDEREHHTISHTHFGVSVVKPITHTHTHTHTQAQTHTHMKTYTHTHTLRTLLSGALILLMSAK